MIPLEYSSQYNRIESLRSAVDNTLAIALAGVQPPRLREGMQHAIQGGKRIRPLMLLFASAAVGGKESDALLAAGAVEMLHTSSLIHDDIMDGADMRRGQAVIHRLYDDPTAILAGDAFIARAYKLLQQLESQRKGQIVATFTEAFVDVCEGQGYDLWLPEQTELPDSLHRTMVEKKTARLLEAALAIGVTLGTSDDSCIQGAKLFGHNVGMAFQAHDDLLDVIGDEASLGKQVGVDARNGKHTYLTLAYPHGNAPVSIESDRIRHTREVIVRHTDLACLSLNALPPTADRELLRMMASSLTERTA